jgi:F420-non-reducing hydrogenase large subunit
LHFYFLGGPDFIVGIKAEPSERNVMGVLKKYGMDVGREVIKHRGYGQRIVEIVGGKTVHPVTAIPGGLSKSISMAQRDEVKKMARSCIDFAEFTLGMYDRAILQNADNQGLLFDKDFETRNFDVCLVDNDGNMNLYDGHIRISGPDGSTYATIKDDQYFDHFSEKVMEWSYVKFPYLKRIGWNGFTEAPENGIIRVGPLARMNVTKGMATPKAQEEYERMTKTFKSKPINNIFAYHWARLIELMYSSERVLELSQDKNITSDEVRSTVKESKLSEGFGFIEAARGTLMHWYKPTKDALVQAVDFIPPTTSNNPAMNVSIRKAASRAIRHGKVDKDSLNMVEVAMRTYDPCMACASHIFGERKYEIRVFDHRGSCSLKHSYANRY